MSTTTTDEVLTEDTLVEIIHLDGSDYEDAVDAINDRGGSIKAAAEYLAGWDYGTENDNAAPLTGDLTTREELERQPHMLHDVKVGGLDYIVQIDHMIGTYALYRAPLDPRD